MSEKKSIYQAIFGRDDIPISTEVTFTPEGERTVIVTTLILAVSAIIITAIAKGSPKRPLNECNYSRTRK